MRSRRKAREGALQALYQCDTLNDFSNESVTLYFNIFHKELTNELEKREPAERECFEFCRSLAFGAVENLQFLDAQLSACSTNWSIQRMCRVDRNILRVAAYEIAFLPQVPVSVSINEAIEIAKLYGTVDSPVFINGVLDNVARTIKVRGVVGEQGLKKEVVNA